MEFQYNDKKHSAIEYTPFEIDFWKMPIEGRPNNKDRITKIKDFPQETTEKLGKTSGRIFNHLAIE